MCKVKEYSSKTNDELQTNPGLRNKLLYFRKKCLVSLGRSNYAIDQNRGIETWEKGTCITASITLCRDCVRGRRMRQVLGNVAATKTNREGRARKGQPTEPRTSFASPIFLGVVVAVGELRADAVKGFSGSEMVSDLMNQVSILNLHNMRHFLWSLQSHLVSSKLTWELYTVLSPSIFTSCEQYCLLPDPSQGNAVRLHSPRLLSCFCVFYS